VWVDGRLVIDSSTPHESNADAAALGGGRHEIRVEILPAARMDRVEARHR
jgi:hypothetical protein